MMRGTSCHARVSVWAIVRRTPRREMTSSSGGAAASPSRSAGGAPPPPRGTALVAGGAPPPPGPPGRRPRPPRAPLDALVADPPLRPRPLDILDRDAALAGEPPRGRGREGNVAALGRGGRSG